MLELLRMVDGGLATPSLPAIITATASCFTAISLLLAAFYPILKLLRSTEKNGKTLETVHTLVNGNLHRERERNEQLIELLQHNGIDIPPYEKEEH